MYMLAHGLARLRRFARRCVDTVRVRFRQWTKPRPPSLATRLATDLVRSRRDLLLENAFLRQQVIVLSRTDKRPAFTPWDRGLLVLLASRLRTWAIALLIVQPETVLRWHRQGFRLFWRRRSAPRARPSPLAAATIALIGQMARDNPLWGAERIRGELLKLGIRVSKRTIQKYMRDVGRRPSGQSWATFLRNHAHETWACDFLQLTDVRFRPLFAFFLVELASRRVVHVGVTRHPTDAWVTQQLREATPFDERPRFLIRDNDAKYGRRFDQLAEASSITVLRTPVRAPRANAITERFLRSVRGECLDHLLLLGERQLRRVLREYVAYFNQARPHQGLGRRVPVSSASAAPTRGDASGIIAVPVLGGWHHTHQRAA
jgi:transposase InsO family protein